MAVPLLRFFITQPFMLWALCETAEQFYEPPRKLAPLPMLAFEGEDKQKKNHVVK